MQLRPIIDEYKTCADALTSAINSEENARIREYDTRMNWLRNVIRDFSASAREDIDLQVDFFMEAISLACDIEPRSSLFKDLQAVINRYIDTPSVKTPSTLAELAGIGIDTNGLVSDPGNVSADAATMIARTNLRISAFGTDMHYTYASPANGHFYGIPTEEFRGKHVAEMIGYDRFAKRARNYFDKCFAGEDQCYYYYLDHEKRGQLLLECRMLRQSGANNGLLGAVVVMRDLTDGYVDPIRSAEENRI
jgi:PAS domain-containing protein